ncbi:MAG: ATP-binding protein [Bacteroidia bacterium]|nr:ATP-binding protein [Bacteroidia bacterium]
MTKRENPFRYGIAVDDPYFADREQELKDYSKWLTTGQSLVVYSPRRYGKTSLMLKILKKLKQEGYHTVYIDFFRVTSRHRFAELYYSEILKQMPSWQKTIKKLYSLTKRIRPVISVDEQGIPVVSLKFEERPGSEELTELFDLPQKLSDKKGWIIVFDEFQEINKLNGDSFEKEMRASLIHHTNVGYAFLGSKMHMLLNMFTRENRAFYQFGKITELRKLPVEIMVEYLQSGYKKTGIDIKEGIASGIINTCEAIPHYIQYLASAAWEEAVESKAGIDDIILGKAIQKIIINQAEYFTSQYERLTLHQQNVLKAISSENENIFNAGFTVKYNLNAISSVQRSTERLLAEGILVRQQNAYFFTDPFFKMWLTAI